MTKRRKIRIKYKSKLLRKKEEEKNKTLIQESQHKAKIKEEKPKNEEKSKVKHNTEVNVKVENEKAKSEKSKHLNENKNQNNEIKPEVSKLETVYKKKVKVKKKINVWAIISIVELIILLILLLYNPNPHIAKSNDKNANLENDALSQAGKKAEVEFFVMAYCPFGNQAEEFIYDVYKKMKDVTAFKPHYVIYTNYHGGGEDYCIKDTDGTAYCSMHGIQELHQDIREMCVEKYYGIEKWFEFATTMNDKCNSRNADTCWESVAKDLGIDINKIKECQEKEGLDMIKEEYALDQKYGVSGSPTIFINYQPYKGSRSAVSMMKELCKLDEIKDESMCKDLPECSSDSDCPQKEGKIAKCENPGTKDAKCVYHDDARVELIVVNDDECPICDTTGIMNVNRRFFPNLVVKNVEADSDEGKKLIEEYNIQHLPAYIFSENVTKAAAWQQRSLSRFFVKVKDKYLLKDVSVGSTWPADPDKRKEYEELLKNYDKHNLEVLNYTGNKPRLDYFVMAFCPFGNPAEEAAAKIYNLLGDNVIIVPHYILSTNGKTLSSLHGVQEANQDIRELCALDLFGLKRFFDFVLQVNKECNSGNADSCWKGAAKNAGFSDDEINQIETCFNTKKFKLAEKEENLTDSLYTMSRGSLTHISASPTFLINGKTYSGSRDPNAIKNVLCALFTDSNKPEECEQTINTSQQGSVNGGTC